MRVGCAAKKGGALGLILVCRDLENPPVFFSIFPKYITRAMKQGDHPTRDRTTVRNMTHSITRMMGWEIGNGPALARGIAVFAFLLVALLAFTAPAMAVENGGNLYAGSTSPAQGTTVVYSTPATTVGDDAGSTILCLGSNKGWNCAPGNPVATSKVTGSPMENSKTRVVTPQTTPA
jgi:hypothetical protein